MDQENAPQKGDFDQDLIVVNVILVFRIQSMLFVFFPPESEVIIPELHY